MFIPNNEIQEVRIETKTIEQTGQPTKKVDVLLLIPLDSREPFEIQVENVWPVIEAVQSEMRVYRDMAQIEQQVRQYREDLIRKARAGTLPEGF